MAGTHSTLRYSISEMMSGDTGPSYVTHRTARSVQPHPVYGITSCWAERQTETGDLMNVGPSIDHGAITDDTAKRRRDAVYTRY